MPAPRHCYTSAALVSRRCRIQPNGELVNVSQVAKGWTGFFIKVEIDGPSRGGGNSKGSLAARVGDLALSFTPGTFPELFNGGGGTASEAAASSYCGKNIDMVVRVRLRPRFVQAGARRGANSAVPYATFLPEGAAAADVHHARKSTKGPNIQKAGQVLPAEGAAAPSKEGERACCDASIVCAGWACCLQEMGLCSRAPTSPLVDAAHARHFCAQTQA